MDPRIPTTGISKSSWLLPILLLGTGCGGGKIGRVIVDMPRGSISKSELLLVKDFDSSKAVFEGDHTDKPEKVAEERQGIPGMITAELVTSLKKRGFNAEKYTPAAAQKDVVVIDGTVTRVDHGSSSARFWVGMGAGSAAIDAHLKIYKSKSPQEAMAELMASGTSGARGGASAWSDWVRKNAIDMARKLAQWLDRKSAP